MIRRLVVIALISLFAVGCATSKRWGRLALEDARAVATAPAHMTKRQWVGAGVAAAAIVGAKALDDEVAELSREGGQGTEDIAEFVEPFGGRYSDRVMAGFLVAGLVTKNSKAKQVAFDAYVSSLLATKVIAPAIKQATGRERPNGSGDDSFPSNHATQAFAVATVIAAHYDRWYVDAAAYTLATGVGWTRIRHDAHYFSDVVAGAVLGTVVGRVVVRTNERERAKWTVQPVVSDAGRGFVVHVHW